MKELQFDGKKRKLKPNFMIGDWRKNDINKKQKLPHAYYWSSRDT